MNTDAKHYPSLADLWGLANDMREAENGAFKTKDERLAEYELLRAQLEARLATIEGRPLPDDHHLSHD